MNLAPEHSWPLQTSMAVHLVSGSRTELFGHLRIPICLRDPRRSEKLFQDTEQTIKMRSQNLPEATQHRSQVKKWNLTKT